MSIDSRGFRGEESAGRECEKRVAVYGDSLVMAEYVPLDQTFVCRLEARLRASMGVGVESINAGVTGYGPDQACLKLEGEIDHLALDLVVLVLCAHNDFGDLMRNKLFDVARDGSLRARRPVLSDFVRAKFDAARRRADRPALWRLTAALFERRSRWLAWKEARALGRTLPYASWYLEECEQEYRDYLRNDLVFNLFQDTYDADVSIRPDSASARFKVSLMRSVLARIQRVCDRREVALLAVIVPSAVDVSPGFEIVVNRDEYPSYDPRGLTYAMSRILDDVGVECVDLTDAILASGRIDDLFVGYDDFHWSALGQDFAARVCAARLAKMSW